MAPVSGWVYRLILRHRPFFLKLTRLLWGETIGASRYEATARLFLRGLAAVYFVAFLSLIPQLPGLAGPQGLLPAVSYLERLRAHDGPVAYWFAPTLAWFGAHAGGLQFMAFAGALCAVLAFGGILTAPCFLMMWALYLSLAVVGRDFMAFPWDGLLLEAGFLAIFLVPFRRRAGSETGAGASATVVWLYRFLLFRFLLSSGISKLMAGGFSWRALSALASRFETQPSPTPLAWFVHRLPSGLLAGSAAATLAIETFVPLLFLLPRRARALGALTVAVWQLSIMATGNHAFLNWLILALCVPLLDDGLIGRHLPVVRKRDPGHPLPEGRLRRWSVRCVATLAIVFGLSQLAGFFLPLSRMLLLADAVISPLRLVNGYGLSGTPPSQGLEIAIEGSDDGSAWKEYVLRDEPGDVKRAPRFIAPFQSRLDFRMRESALSGAGQGPWFAALMLRLLQGSRPTLALFRENPFPSKPPKFVRAVLYAYRFTEPDERAIDGAWRRRRMVVEYLRPISIENLTGGTP